MIGMDDLDYPGKSDLLAACGLLLFENDAMLAELGHPHSTRVRIFTRHDLERGRNMGPMAWMTEEGSIGLRLES